MLSFANNPSVSNLRRFNEITDSCVRSQSRIPNELLRMRNECYLLVAGTFDSCRSPKLCPTQSRFGFAKIVYSHAGHHSVSVSACSTAGLWTSGPGCREPRLAAAAGRIQEEAQTACADTMGSIVSGRSVVGLERLASRADFCSARHGGPLATGAIPQILGPTLQTEWPCQGRPAVARGVRRLIRQMAIR